MSIDNISSYNDTIFIQYSYNIWDKQLQYFGVRKLKTESEKQYSNAAAVGGDEKFKLFDKG